MGILPFVLPFAFLEKFPVKKKHFEAMKILDRQLLENGRSDG